MSDFTLRLPARPSIEQLRKQAKELLREIRTTHPGAVLADAQFQLARRYGFETWEKLVHHIETVSADDHLKRFEQMANDIFAVYTTGDTESLRRLNEIYGSLTQESVQEFVHKRLGKEDLTIDDARAFVARQHGFDAWTKLAETTAQPPGDPRTAPMGLSSTPPFYRIDWADQSIEPRQPLTDRDWDRILGIMQDHRIMKLKAGGQMTDAAMSRLADLDHVTSLQLGGSRRLTDEGLSHLARMPQLLNLDVGGWETSITDRGLESLRDLTKLQRLQSCWTRTASDAGFANLRFCENIEEVDLLGSMTGDGVVKAMAGKPRLRRLKTGRLVTDAGIPLLRDIPIFKTWHGGKVEYSLMAFDAEPNHLLLDGSFTNKGFENIVGLDGLFGLTFFWHVSAFTPEGLGPLAKLPKLGYLGCQDALCNDGAMRHIAAIPNLRMLMGQGSVATDDGFTTLSRSQTIEYIWGRKCPNLGGRGFSALGAMPSLLGIAVSCRNVDDASLAALPRFPTLRYLMPMDVNDEGFRHIGRCENLEGLWCMYCRDTGDKATEYIEALPKLKTYYAGASKITDRSLELLGRMSSIETLEFFQCMEITNAGVAHLAKLPRLREITIGGSPGVTREGMVGFSPGVRVNYWT